MFRRLLNAICFWTLTLAAFALFVAAVIMPQLFEYRRHRQIERDMRANTQLIEQRTEQLKRLADQLGQGDPLMVARKAREVLNYQMQSGREIDVAPAAPFVPPSDADPLLLAGQIDDAPIADPLAQRVGPERLGRFQAMIERPRVQRLLMLIACVALCLAFVLFGNPPRRRQPAAL